MRCFGRLLSPMKNMFFLKNVESDLRKQSATLYSAVGTVWDFTDKTFQENRLLYQTENVYFNTWTVIIENKRKVR